MSRSQVSRIERGLVPELSFVAAALTAASVGLELSVKAYPGGRPVRDAGHLALIERLRPAVGPTAAWQFERPLPIAGDQRAWDVALILEGGVAALELETRPRDVQELLRRIALKSRDDQTVSRVVLLLSDTRHNRALLRANRQVIAADLPGAGSAIRAALQQGRLPPQSGVLMV